MVVEIRVGFRNLTVNQGKRRFESDLSPVTFLKLCHIYYHGKRQQREEIPFYLQNNKY